MVSHHADLSFCATVSHHAAFADPDNGRAAVSHHAMLADPETGSAAVSHHAIFAAPETVRSE